MKRYGLFAACWAMLIVACASSGGSGESETHFWKCATDLDCPTNERCVINRCAPTRTFASGVTSSEADSGANGAPNSGGTTNSGGNSGVQGSTGGRTNAGGTGGAQGSSGGATNIGGTDGGPGSVDGSANAGGTGGVAGASSGGGASLPDASAPDATQTDAALPDGSGGDRADSNGGISEQGALACAHAMGFTAGAVAADDDGTLLVTGYYMGPATFGRGEPSETTLTATEGLFLARYRSDCTLVWARSVDGASNAADGNNDGLAVAVRSGVIYLAGSFGASATFGPGETNQSVLTGGGAFLARYSAGGSLEWVRQAIGTSGPVQATGVAVSPTDGNVYVSGWVQDGQGTFGSGEPGEATVGSPPSPPYIVRTLFVARYQPSGSFVRVRSAGGAVKNDSAAFSVAATAEGGALVAGDFTGTVTFGAGDPNQATLTASGSRDAVILRYNEDGSLAWAKQAGGTGEARVFGVAASADTTTIRVVGTFGQAGGGQATFGAGEPRQITLSTGFQGNTDLFVAALNGDGTLAWAKRAGGGGWDLAFAVALDTSGGAAVVGTYGGPFGAFATFGPGEPGQTVLPGVLNNSYEIFVARYDASGALMWARKGGGPSDYDEAYGVAISPDQSVTAVGRFADTMTLNPGEPNAAALTASPYTAAFIARWVR